MATKQEELRNLATIYSALQAKSDLEQKIEDEKEKIEKQEDRYIPDHPEYEPKWREEPREKRERKNKEDEKSTGIFIAVVQWIVFYIALGVSADFLSSEAVTGTFTSDEWVMMVIYVFCMLAAIVLNLIVWRIDMAIKVPVFGAFHGLVTTGSRSVISAVVTTALYFGEVIDETYFVFAILVGVPLPACIALINLIWLLIKKKKKRAAAAQAQLDEEAERERRAAYDREKAAADIVIAQKRKRLAEEVKKIVAACRERIARYKEEIARQERIVAQTPGLAMQDKNLYTVSTLLIYFERGKADSIKEAINLFDHEERERARAEEERFARARAEEAQRYALAEMAKVQREHNDAVEASARRAEERLNKELDELKNKRY